MKLTKQQFYICCYILQCTVTSKEHIPLTYIIWKKKNFSHSLDHSVTVKSMRSGEKVIRRTTDIVCASAKIATMLSRFVLVLLLSQENLYIIIKTSKASSSAKIGCLEYCITVPLLNIWLQHLRILSDVRRSFMDLKLKWLSQVETHFNTCK